MNAASGMTASAEKMKTGTAPHSSISAANATGAQARSTHFQYRAIIPVSLARETEIPDPLLRDAEGVHLPARVAAEGDLTERLSLEGVLCRRSERNSGVGPADGDQ